MKYTFRVIPSPYNQDYLVIEYQFIESEGWNHMMTLQNEEFKNLSQVIAAYLKGVKRNV